MCPKDATGARLVPRKFWLTFTRELLKLEAKGDRRAVSRCVNFGLNRARVLEKNGAVQVQGLGLELPPREPANRDKGSFP
jgi:hypothetical protein